MRWEQYFWGHINRVHYGRGGLLRKDRAGYERHIVSVAVVEGDRAAAMTQQELEDVFRGSEGGFEDAVPWAKY